MEAIVILHMQEPWRIYQSDVCMHWVQLTVDHYQAMLISQCTMTSIGSTVFEIIPISRKTMRRFIWPFSKLFHMQASQPKQKEKPNMVWSPRQALSVGIQTRNLWALSPPQKQVCCPAAFPFTSLGLVCLLPASKKKEAVSLPMHLSHSYCQAK